MVSVQSKRRGVLPQDQKERIDRWVKRSETLIFSVSSNPNDPKSPLLIIGDARIPYHAGWNPPIGAQRAVKIRQTSKGRYYAEPTNAKDLPKGEFDPYGVRYFRETLQYNNKTGRYFFRLHNGMFLVLMNFNLLEKSGIGRYVGRTIELMGWPRATSFCVWPKYGPEGLDKSEQVSETENPEKQAIGIEHDLGLIRISGMTIPAIYVLGISNDEILNGSTVNKAARAMFKQYHPDINKGIKKLTFEGGNLHFDVDELYNKIGEAKEILLKGMGLWFGKTWSEFVRAEEYIENNKEASSANESIRMVTCTCGRMNNLTNASEDKIAFAICGKCKTYLFPERLEAARSKLEAKKKEIEEADLSKLQEIAKTMHIALSTGKRKKSETTLRKEIIEKIVS